MPANTPRVNRFSPFVRLGQVGGIKPASQWADNLVLVANTAKSYTLPTGTDPAGSPVTAAGPAGKTVKGTILRIVVDGGPVWIDANGNVAVIPVADNILGNGPVCIPPMTEYWLSVPVSSQPLSFIADQAVRISLEVWW